MKENIKEMGKSELTTNAQVLENYLEYAQDKDNGVNQPGDQERNENDLLITKEESAYKNAEAVNKINEEYIKKRKNLLNTQDKDNDVNQGDNGINNYRDPKENDINLTRHNLKVIRGVIIFFINK